jgi:hypothetical protein
MWYYSEDGLSNCLNASNSRILSAVLLLKIFFYTSAFIYISAVLISEIIKYFGISSKYCFILSFSCGWIKGNFYYY